MDQVEKRQLEWGFNELPSKTRHPLLVFLSYFWGPMPVMIWIAAGVELAKASAGYGGWEDFTVLMMLQFANATVGYIEERNAGDAIAALKAQLAPQCHVCRDGVWQNMAGSCQGGRAGGGEGVRCRVLTDPPERRQQRPRVAPCGQLVPRPLRHPTHPHPSPPPSPLQRASSSPAT